MQSLVFFSLGFLKDSQLVKDIYTNKHFVLVSLSSINQTLLYFHIMTRQYVWLIRYGKTEFPLVENDGPFDSE